MITEIVVGERLWGVDSVCDCPFNMLANRRGFRGLRPHGLLLTTICVDLWLSTEHYSG